MSQVPIPPAQFEYTYNDPPPPQRPAPLRSYFFLVTIPLAVASWFISLISQSIVTAQIGNVFVGPLWFGIILQLLTLLILFYGILTNTLPTYHATLNTFSTLVIVFAVFGVDRNIFNLIIPAQKALSAGWLILAILNSLWVIYFTTAPTHPVSHVLSYQAAPIQLRIGRTRNLQKQQGEQIEQEEEPRSIPSVPTNIDAFASPRMTRNSGMDSPHSLPNPHRLTRGSNGARSGTQTTSAAMTDPRVISGVSAPTDTHTHTRASAVSPSEPSIRSASNKEPGPSSPSSPVDPAGGAGGGGGTTGTDNGDGAGTGAGAGADGVQGMPSPQKKEFLWRAEALYRYDAQDADPNELSFKKGEVLEISDKSGKWWEGRKTDGTIGIAPSNYLRLL